MLRMILLHKFVWCTHYTEFHKNSCQVGSVCFRRFLKNFFYIYNMNIMDLNQRFQRTQNIFTTTDNYFYSIYKEMYLDR